MPDRGPPSGWPAGKETGLRPLEYHDGLQALRGILAMGVFCQHLFWLASTIVPGPTERLFALNLGGLGVLTFFALSGYLITAKAGDPPLTFLVDRVRRIVPAFWLSIAAVLIAHRWAMPIPWDIVFLLPTGKPNLLPIPHWSLYFECFFYALVLLVALVRASWVRPAVVIWAVLAFLLYQRPYDFAHYSAPDLYNLTFPLFGIYFAAGAVAGWRFTPTRHAAIPYALAALTAFYGLQATAWLDLYRYIPRWVLHGDLGFELIALGTFCAVRAGHCWRAHGLVGRGLTRLGDASYGIYLIHLMSMTVAVVVIRWLYVPTSYLVAMALIVAIALPPTYLFGLLDVRLQRALKRLQRPRMGRVVSSQPAGAGAPATGRDSPVGV